MDEMLRRVAGLQSSIDDARPANIRLGTRIAAEGDIGFEADGHSVVAAVSAPALTGGRTVRFSVTGDDRIEWTCTCVREPSPWCKHAVAAVLSAADRDVDDTGS